MNYETVLIERKNGVAKLIFNRPEKKNAMSPQLHMDAAAALEELRYDDSVKCLVLTGAGDSFCAGMDLKEFFFKLKDQPVEYEKVLKVALEWRGRTLRYFPKPTISMINGYCFGGAFSIVEGCDLAVAAHNATFGLSEINFKGFPGGTVSKTLANLLRPRDALYYGLTGRKFDGRVAAEIGLINYSVPADELEKNVMELAEDIATKDPIALRATKEGYRFALEMSWEASMSHTHALEYEMMNLQGRGDWKSEGIGDFVKGKYRPGLEAHKPS